MSRARSKTVDSTEVRRVKGSGLPRRLNEKIALMKEKEQVQSEAFEQAMKSLFEVGDYFVTFPTLHSLVVANNKTNPGVSVVDTLSISFHDGETCAHPFIHARGRRLHSCAIPSSLCRGNQNLCCQIPLVCSVVVFHLQGGGDGQMQW